MFGITGYGAFIASSIALHMVPGVDTIYILSRSMAGGIRHGVVSALGISTGVLLHTLLAAFGLSVILERSAAAFGLMKLAGSAYLMFLGLQALLQKQDGWQAGTEAKTYDLRRVYRQGVLTNALNPKVALFFLALLPQFVSPDNGYGALPFLLLGLTFFTTSTVWCLMIAAASGFFSNFLRRNERIRRLIGKLSGCVYIVLGLNVLRASQK